MGTPGQPVRLIGDRQNPEALGVRTPGLNVTRPLRAYGRKVAGNIDGQVYLNPHPPALKLRNTL